MCGGVWPGRGLGVAARGGKGSARRGMRREVESGKWSEREGASTKFWSGYCGEVEGGEGSSARGVSGVRARATNV